jgi:hypothetical protein
MKGGGSSPPSEPLLDAVAVRVVAYGRQERTSAIEAARLHVEALRSGNVPGLPLKYSNYLSPSAKAELLKQLKGVGNVKAILSTVRTSVTEARLPYADLLPDFKDFSKEISKFPAYAKAVAVVVAGVVAWFILKAVFTFVVQPLFSIIWYAALLAAGYWTFVKTVLEERTPVLVANEVALEAAIQGSKSVVKDRLQLVLIRHGVQKTGEVIDELWEILSPPQCPAPFSSEP